MERIDTTGWRRMQFIRFYQEVWHCPVIPMKEVTEDGEPTKKPMVTWTPYQSRMPTEVETLSWFTPPYAGIPNWAIKDGSPREPWGLAIVLQHNLFSVDLDSEEVYQYLKQRGAYPPGACIFKTRKGYHVIMRASDMVPYTIREGMDELIAINPLFKDLGIGGDNNHLSIMPDTPDREWVQLYNEPTALEYEPWLEKHLGWSKRMVRDTPRLTDYVDMGDWWTKALEGVSEGERDNTCIRLAAHYREKGLSQRDTVAILSDWAERCQPPFPRKDVEKCVRSAYGYDKSAQKEQVKGNEYGPPQSLNDLLSSIQTSPQLIGGLVNRGDLVMVYGTTGVGKSSLLEYIVACACAGVNIADIFLVMQPLRALFIDTQMAPVEVGLRFETLFNALGKGLENFSIKTYSDFDIVKQQAQRWLYDTVKDGRYDLVALDPFEDIHHLNENYTTEMGQVVAPLRRVANELDCAILIGHHAGGDQYDNKGRLLPKKPRGATAITDRMDSIFELLDTENQYEKLFHVRKMRRALINRQKDIILKYDPETLLISLGGPPVIARAYKQGAAERYEILQALLQVKAKGITDEEIARQLGVNRSTVTRWISGIRKPPAETQAKFPALLKWAEGRGG
jgi:RecA-family ATPase